MHTSVFVTLDDCIGLLLAQGHIDAELEACHHTSSSLPMPGTTSTLDLFPPLTRAGLNQFRTSAWHTRFQRITIKTTVIETDEVFRAYMNADGVTIPRGADDR